MERTVLIILGLAVSILAKPYGPVVPTLQAGNAYGGQSFGNRQYGSKNSGVGTESGYTGAGGTAHQSGHQESEFTSYQHSKQFSSHNSWVAGGFNAGALNAGRFNNQLAGSLGFGDMYRQAQKLLAQGVGR